MTESGGTDEIVFEWPFINLARALGKSYYKVLYIIKFIKIILPYNTAIEIA